MWRFCLLFLFFFFLIPLNALALQSHGPPEGLYVHQVAHVLFGASMLFLFLFLHIHPLGRGKAWRYFKLSLLFFLMWNVDAFLTHWMATNIPDDAIIGGGSILKSHLTGPISFIELLYYIGKFDHILCVPAMFFLTLSLRTFYREAVDGEKSKS